MALTTLSPRASLPPAFQTVIVPTPKAGKEVIVSSSPGGRLHLGFDPGAATVSREGNDLIFILEGDGRAVVGNFFTIGNAGFPALLLPDGTVVAGADFFSGRDLDITPAAGPASRPPSGGTLYEDDPGELLDGVDRLDALEPSFWDREEESSPASPADDPGNSFSAGAFSPRADAGDSSADGEDPSSSGEGGDAGDSSVDGEDSSPSGEGGDVFPFAALGNGEMRTDIVEDFVILEDVLRFEGLIDGRDADILTDQLKIRLGAEEGDPGKLSVDAVTEEGLSLSIGGRTVEVRFEEAGHLSEDQVLALRSDDIQSQIEVLKLLFITTG